MPLYRFVIHGTGIQDADGFYTGRRVIGSDYEDAASKAIEIVRRDWTTGRSSKLSPGQPPTVLEIDSGGPVGWLEFLTAPNRGNVIYRP